MRPGTEASLLMTRNDLSFLVQTPRQKERRLASATSLVLEKAQPSATFLRGISERCWERGLWEAKQLRLSTEKAFSLHFFFLSFDPSTVLEGATSKKKTQTSMNKYTQLCFAPENE